MALKKQATPKRWRSKEAKEIVVAVQRAGGQVERTASGHLKVIGPAGSAIVAFSPQRRPRRWAGRPQHPGDDQKQDRAVGMNARLGVALSLQKFLELPEVSGYGVSDTRHGDSSKQVARAAEF